MLVFTRKIDQGIVIGDGIEVKILRVGRDGVRIGVTASPDVPVHRSEIYAEIRRRNAGAAGDAAALGELVARLRSERTE